MPGEACEARIHSLREQLAGLMWPADALSDEAILALAERKLAKWSGKGTAYGRTRWHVLADDDPEVFPLCYFNPKTRAITNLMKFRLCGKLCGGCLKRVKANLFADANDWTTYVPEHAQHRHLIGLALRRASGRAIVPSWIEDSDVMLCLDEARILANEDATTAAEPLQPQSQLGAATSCDP